MDPLCVDVVVVVALVIIIISRSRIRFVLSSYSFVRGVSIGSQETKIFLIVVCSPDPLD